MPKALQLTANLIEKIKKSLNDQDVDASNFAVYEARLYTTEPVNARGFYQKARAVPSLLHEMAEFVNQPGTNVPIMIMHKTEDVLPVGRLFHAETAELQNGETELRGLFYIPKSGDAELEAINKIENSTVDEVSVGVLPKQALCSECGFDYFGPEASIMNLMTLTCEDDHTIGINGAHVRCVGLEQFAETSLVGRGAAKDAKIFSRAQSRLSEETVERLAASAVPAEAHVLTASYKLDSSKPKPKENAMSGIEAKLAEVSGELGGIKVELSQANEKIEGLNSEIDSLKAQLEEKEKEVEDLKASQSEEEKADAEAEAKLSEATEKLLPHVKAALVAAGENEDDLPETLVELTELIEDKGLKLHQAVGAGATSAGKKQDDGSEDEAKARRKSSFKLN